MCSLALFVIKYASGFRSSAISSPIEPDGARVAASAPECSIEAGGLAARWGISPNSRLPSPSEGTRVQGGEAAELLCEPIERPSARGDARG